MKEPQFKFEWTKEGVPGIQTLSNGNCLLIIRDELKNGETKFKQYFILSQIKKDNFSNANYEMMMDIFTHQINSLWVLIVNSGDDKDVLDTDKFILIENENIDYGIFPEAAETDEVSIISFVNAVKTKLNPIKWIFKGNLSQPKSFDKPYFIKFYAEEMTGIGGTKLTMEQMLPTVMAQRAACPFTQSLTYKPITKILDAKRVGNIEESLTNGFMTIIKINKKWVYARDINTLVTLGDLYDDRFKQNQRIVVMDSIVKDIRNSWQTCWVGNYQNSAKNKNAFSSSCNVYITKRMTDLKDPVENGIFEINLEEHKNVLRLAGKTEEYIKGLNLAQLENVDTGTFVYIQGKIQINGIMEDIEFKIAATVDFKE